LKKHTLITECTFCVKTKKHPMKIRSAITTILLVATSAISLGLQSCGGSEIAKVDCSKVTINIQAIVTTADCPQANGSITIKATGGAGDYEYNLDGGADQTSNIFKNINGGIYKVSVKDADGCAASQDITVPEISNVRFDFTATPAGCDTSTGGLTIIASNGDGNYQYQVDDGAFQASGEFAGLSYGMHTVSAKDGGGCQTISEVYVPSGISYQASVADIMKTSCAVTGCHVAGTGRQDFETFSVIQANANDIKTRTQSGNMPRNSSITEEQKQAIACWVDDGAMDN